MIEGLCICGKLSHQFGGYHKKIPHPFLDGGFYRKEFGGDLLSHQVALAVPSAQKSLTSVIGTGTGVTSSLLPPKIEVSVPADFSSDPEGSDLVEPAVRRAVS